MMNGSRPASPGLCKRVDALLYLETSGSSERALLNRNFRLRPFPGLNRHVWKRGMFNLDGAPVARESLTGMIWMLARRGPDGHRI